MAGFKDNWQDLGPRVASGIVMAVIFVSAVVWGGFPFSILVIAAGGLLIWEVARMARVAQPEVIGLVAAGLVAVALRLPEWADALLFALVAGAIFLGGKHDRKVLAFYGFFALLACDAFWLIRAESLRMALWLALVVVASDVMGYIAGRMIGGPKFWPAISPKKTWSGTIAGWIGAAVVGVLVMPQAGWIIVPVSVLMSFAGQMGDVAESALKRRAGVKDSSNLIPGHGGVMDRFDAMMGAALVVEAFVLIAGAMFGVHGWR